MNIMRRREFEVPLEVSGRPENSRRVHLQPFGFHGFWLDREYEDHCWLCYLPGSQVLRRQSEIKDDTTLEMALDLWGSDP